MLSAEIAASYGRGERTRKVHHPLYAPTFDAADQITASLASDRKSRRRPKADPRTQTSGSCLCEKVEWFTELSIFLPKKFSDMAT